MCGSRIGDWHFPNGVSLGWECGNKEVRFGSGTSFQVDSDVTTPSTRSKIQVKGRRSGALHAANYIALATSTAVSSWISIPLFKLSRESSTQNFGTIPLFSSIRPRQVR